MRALVIEPGPAFSVDDVRRGICLGLQTAGVEVVSFNLGARVEFYTDAKLERGGEVRAAFDYESACTLACNGVKAAAWDFFGPYGGVVVIVSSFFIPPELYTNLRQRGVHVVLWLTESPYEDERQVPMAAFADTVIVNDPTNIDEFRAVNPNTHYIPHGYLPQVHHAKSRTGQYGFSFVGTGYPSRIEFFEKMDWPCTPVLAGNWQSVADDSPLVPYLLHERGECMENDDAANLYRASVTSANLYRKEAMADDLVDGWAIGPREVELAACGTYFGREPRAEGDGLFPMLPTFTEPGELADIIRWALEHPDERFAAAQQARAAIADRTFDNHAKELLRLIGA
jgi:spore maturation protein CgeB